MRSGSRELAALTREIMAESGDNVTSARTAVTSGREVSRAASRRLEEEEEESERDEALV